MAVLVTRRKDKERRGVQKIIMLARNGRSVCMCAWLEVVYLGAMEKAVSVRNSILK